MGFLKLISDLTNFLLSFPRKLMFGVNRFYYQRVQASKHMVELKREGATVSRVWRFLGWVGRVLLWLLILAAVVGLLWGLWWLNQALDLERVLGGPFPFLRQYWLPLLVILAVGTCWLGRYLWKLLGPEKEFVEFPDIDDAWREARAALVEAGLDLSGVPVFLVLGRPAKGIDTLFLASRLAFAVRQVPLRTGVPLQVYANPQGIYVAGFGASLLGRQEEMLYEMEEAEATPQPGHKLNYVFDEPPTSLVPETAPEPEVGGNWLAPAGEGVFETSNALATLEAAGTTLTAGQLAKLKAKLPSWKRTEEIDQEKKRLAYLCKLIARDRRPYCPVNGVLVVLPFEALENDDDASQLASMCQQDLEIIRDGLQTRCPIAVLVCDLETAPGFTSFLDSLEAERRMRLLGRDFPLSPDLRPEELPGMVVGGLEHFLQSFGNVVFKLFRVEKPDESPMLVSANNTRLYELWSALGTRQRGLERILQRLLAPDLGLGFFLSGFFFAGTGYDPDRDQAFVPGVFRLLQEKQNAVAWTSDALAEEAEFQRWTMIGYASVGIFCLVMLVIVMGRWSLVRG